MTEAIRKIVDEEVDENSREAARRRLLDRIRNATDWGTGGKITWTRDEIHER
jgi:hypothetical protein